MQPKAHDQDMKYDIRIRVTAQQIINSNSIDSKLEPIQQHLRKQSGLGRGLLEKMWTMLQTQGQSKCKSSIDMLASNQPFFLPIPRSS